jgi:hypothetical protein
MLQLKEGRENKRKKVTKKEERDVRDATRREGKERIYVSVESKQNFNRNKNRKEGREESSSPVRVLEWPRGFQEVKVK